MKVGALELINVNFLTLTLCLKEGLAKIGEVSSIDLQNEIYVKIAIFQGVKGGSEMALLFFIHVADTWYLSCR